MSGTPATNLNTPDNWQRLTEGQEALNRAVAGVQVLEACGIECQRQKELIRYYDQQLAKMRSAIFPNGSPGKKRRT